MPVREPEDLPMRLGEMLPVTGNSFRQCSGIPLFSTQHFTRSPPVMAGRKEDEVNQGAIFRALYALGIFLFFGGEEKREQLHPAEKM